MGKKNFKQIYQKIKNELDGPIRCKVSFFCDDFDPSKNYACILVYMIDGECEWKNQNGGRADGYTGRSFYLIIQSTDKWPDTFRREAGRGRVHHYPLLNVLGIDFAQNRIACGGFAYHDGKLKFSSIWLNQANQAGADSDGNKLLSTKETTLANYCFDQYKRLGKNSTFVIPDYIDRILLS